VDRRPRRDVEDALAWLAAHAHENLGTEIALRQALPGSDIAFVRDGEGKLASVSISAPAGQWFLEANGLDATAELVAAVASRPSRRWPAKATVSGTLKPWLQPLLAEHGVGPVREHDLLAMVCRRPAAGADGRWATPADRPALERYQTLYNEERRTTIAPDWDSLLARQTVAVLEAEGRLVAVVKRTTDTARYATIGGTWTDPAFRGRGLARRLTAFLIGSLLAERPAVHLIVDDDNAAAIALYRSLGFGEVGSCWMGYLP